MGLRGYRVFTDAKKDLNLNIVGWRSAYARPDHYDDFIALYWQEPGEVWKMRGWPATTVPGKPWLLSPLVGSGAAILVPGQYVSTYKIGRHRGYIALRQVAPVLISRDNDLDEKPEVACKNVETGLFGIHIHKGDVIGTTINRNSAGCQVFKDRKDFDEFIEICVNSSLIWGDTFTYTLLEF